LAWSFSIPRDDGLFKTRDSSAQRLGGKEGTLGTSGIRKLVQMLYRSAVRIEKEPRGASLS
jgi:hypothetical protein